MSDLRNHGPSDVSLTDTSVRDALTRAAAVLGGRRRLLAAGFAAVAVVAGLRAVTPAPAPTVAVWVAAHDLGGGAALRAADVRTVGLPPAAVPAGALRVGDRVVGRLLAAPVRRGEPLTDLRLLGPSLLAALPDPGLVAVPVRVADGSAAAALVHAGDVIDVLAAADPAGGGPRHPTTVASGVRVLSVPGTDHSDGSGDGLVVVAASAEQAAALAQASTTARLSLALQRP
ncbi:MAG TPA: Flp pilus assembly protein CpaB [Mycobacteriales bacterium]|nr:Flp pilus assembly protein CpaB [Mycobacteriales bacterium]